MKEIPKSHNFDMLATAFSQSQKSNVAAISALAGAVGKVESRIAAWEQHYLPLIVDKLPVYIPQKESNTQAMEAETPLYTSDDVMHLENVGASASASAWCMMIGKT